MEHLVKSLQHIQLCNVQWSVPFFCPLTKSFYAKDRLRCVSAKDKNHIEMCVPGWSGEKVQERASNQLPESDQKSVGPVGTVNLGINVAEIELQDNRHGFQIGLIQLSKDFLLYLSLALSLTTLSPSR